MEKAKMRTAAGWAENLGRLQKLFPHCVAEARGADGALCLKLDKETLLQELSAELIEEGEERYSLNWPGKKESLLAANTAIDKTLRPVMPLSNPIQSNPIQSNPIQSNPIQSNPIQSNPIQSNPIQSNRRVMRLYL